jgi:alpha-D-xyloside xylohydrolase
MSLFPYRYAAAQDAAKTGMPLMRALVLQNQNDEQARTIKDEYMLGPDFLVAPVVDAGTQRAVYLPKGEWVDYWSGAAASGGKTVVVDAPIDKLPLYVRDGAVIAKIPEDVMTLVLQSESGNKHVKTLDDRRVYEVYVGGDNAVTDFEGRALKRSGSSLTITGDTAARVTVRWRFGAVKSVTVNGAAVNVQTGASGAFVEFEHAKSSEVKWQ